jgi:hypothetical protein
MGIHEELNDVVASIRQLEEERRRIYNNAQITFQAQARLGTIEDELQRLWDLRHRLHAAKRAGLREIPIPPAAHLEEQVR